MQGNFFNNNFSLYLTFYTLLEKVEHTSLRDETALSMIREEVAPFLAGERSAEDAARLIQSRISIYVSEQGK